MPFYKIESPNGELFAVAPSGTVDVAFDSYCRKFNVACDGDMPLVSPISRDEYEAHMAELNA